MNSDQAVLDHFSAALARLDGDVNLLRNMASITSEDLPEVIQQTEAAISEGDSRQAASGLHRLKGMLSTFEADGVVLDIQDMLDAARQDKMTEVQENYRKYKSDVAKLVQQVAKLASGT